MPPYYRYVDRRTGHVGYFRVRSDEEAHRGENVFDVQVDPVGYEEYDVYMETGKSRMQDMINQAIKTALKNGSR
jgi:hypothetical protein